MEKQKQPKGAADEADDGGLKRRSNGSRIYAGMGYEVQFQQGPSAEKGRNGCSPEDLLRLVLARLAHYDKLQPCRENAQAINRVEEGLLWLLRRKQRRAAQGVKGTQQRHADSWPLTAEAITGVLRTCACPCSCGPAPESSGENA